MFPLRLTAVLWDQPLAGRRLQADWCSSRAGSKSQCTYIHSVLTQCEQNPLDFLKLALLELGFAICWRRGWGRGVHLGYVKAAVCKRKLSKTSVTQRRAYSELGGVNSGLSLIVIQVWQRCCSAQRPETLGVTFSSDHPSKSAPGQIEFITHF